MEKIINVGGRLHNPVVGGALTGADEIKDDLKGKMQNVINQETDAELVRLDEAKQEKLTFDQTPTENSTNPVTSGGVYAADAALQQAIEAILLLIPSAASALNQLADKSFVNSSIATATATFRGTYNLVTDLELTVSATHQQIAAALASVISTADNNDYCFVQIPVSDQSSDIRVTERYKFDGTSWEYEYNLNNSGFTADQWGAINSGITSILVNKLGGLPTAAELATMFAGKQNTLTFDNIPVAGSDNPVKSSGLYNAFEAINALIPEGADANNKLVAESRLVAYVTTLINALDATFDVTSADGHVTLRMTQADGVITSVQILTSDIASASAFATLGGRVSTAESDIDALQEAYAALTQSDVVIVNGALPSSGQQQNIIYRQPDQEHTPPQYYSDYMWNGTTWVLMATYMNAIDPRPKKGSQNLVTSGGVFDNMGALDVSELNATENPHTLATYADLSAALAAIPSDYKKGGMSIKFVQTSDNKYVQYFLTKDSWSTQDYDWKKVNIKEEVSALLIKLKGFGTSGAYVGATNIGDVYFNTNTNTLQRKFRLDPSPTFEEVPFYDGAVYQYNNDLYTWNGSKMVIHKRISILSPMELSIDTQSINIPEEGQVCDLTPLGSATFHYGIFNVTEDAILIIHSGEGGGSARLWGWLDSTNKVLQRASSNENASNLIIYAPSGATKLVVNCKNEWNGELFDGVFAEVWRLIEKNTIKELGLPSRLSVTENLNGISDNTRKTMCLCGLKTQITHNSMPYTDVLLWHEYPIALGNKLYYSESINGGKKEYGAVNNWDLSDSLFAVSPKDGRVIITKNKTRGGICIFDGTNTTILNNIDGKIPSGWLYNSGVDFINDGEDEYCVFAEYGVYDVYYVWRGKYPYTSASDWSVVMSKGGPYGEHPEIMHFHTIRRDPWTNILYCTSGDYPGEQFWWYSLDKGVTWTQLTDGTLWENNCARNIGFIFTEDYIYWATDNGENHTFNRATRNINTGIVEISSREKVADLPYGQATNSICYVDELDGVFFYERLDTGFQDVVRGYFTLFYSFKTNKLYKLNYYTLNESDYQETSGQNNTAWGGHRGKCYINYANNQIKYPAMGFLPSTPCIINMIGVDNINIGTIYYK